MVGSDQRTCIALKLFLHASQDWLLAATKEVTLFMMCK
jgi:hypothetical protein